MSPEGTRQEQANLQAVSSVFESEVAARHVPDVPTPAEWRDVLSRALLSNGDLEAAYFEWKAALARVEEQATWPNSNVALNFSYMFSPQQVKAWNRTTVGIGFDPSMNLSVPAKSRTAGLVALDSAREAGDKFRGMKFDLQRKVLTSYFDLALTEERARIGQESVAFLALLRDSAATRAAAGGSMEDLFKAIMDRETELNGLASLNAKAASMRSQLNGMLGRAADAPLVLPAQLPAPRVVNADDSTLIALSVQQNPELAALAHAVAGRSDAIELARLAYIPDFSPSASITGDIAQSLGTMVMLPSKLPAIRAAIHEAEAMQRSATAALRQTHHDRAASFVANLYLMRNAERQLQRYKEHLVPAAEQLVSRSRSAYAAGTLGLADLIESERAQLTVRRMLAETQIEREERLTDLETLAGVDIETLGPPQAAAIAFPSARATQPSKGDTHVN